MFLFAEPSGSVACARCPSCDRQWAVARPTGFLTTGFALSRLDPDSAFPGLAAYHTLPCETAHRRPTFCIMSAHGHPEKTQVRQDQWHVQYRPDHTIGARATIASHLGRSWPS